MTRIGDKDLQNAITAANNVEDVRVLGDALTQPKYIERAKSVIKWFRLGKTIDEIALLSPLSRKQIEQIIANK
jgi:hypothetical protein